MAIVYRKSSQGRAEIETRARRLAPRLRTLLIMVDGQRSDDDLAKLVAATDVALQTLLEQGLIERVAELPPAAASAAPPRAPVPPPLPVAGRENFIERRRQAVRTLTDAVGPVGEALALRIEKARDEPVLRPLLVLACESIRNVRGAAAADTFRARFLG